MSNNAAARKRRRRRELYAEHPTRQIRSDSKRGDAGTLPEWTSAQSFAVHFPYTHSPYGVSSEMDALILDARVQDVESDRDYLGVRVESVLRDASRNTYIHLHVLDDVTMPTVVRIANTIAPPERGSWVIDERTVMNEQEDGWLVTLFAS